MDARIADYDKRTLLHVACSLGQLEAATLLLEYGAEVFFAIWRLLLDYGAEVLFSLPAQVTHK